MNRIPPSELCLMKVIWSSSEPLSSRQIIDILEEEKGWKRTTILTLLSRLAERGFLSTEKIKRYTYYTPLVDKDDYVKLETKEFFDKIHENSLKSLVTALHENHDLSDKDLENLEKWVKEK